MHANSFGWNKLCFITNKRTLPHQHNIRVILVLQFDLSYCTARGHRSTSVAIYTTSCKGKFQVWQHHQTMRTTTVIWTAIRPHCLCISVFTAVFLKPQDGTAGHRADASPKSLILRWTAQAHNLYQSHQPVQVACVEHHPCSLVIY